MAPDADRVHGKAASGAVAISTTPAAAVSSSTIRTRILHLFQRTAKMRREIPSQVHMSIADGSYVQELRQACSATSRLGLYADNDLRLMLEATAFRDWLKTEHARWTKAVATACLAVPAPSPSSRTSPPKPSSKPPARLQAQSR
jgi:hypothetical protein